MIRWGALATVCGVFWVRAAAAADAADVGYEAVDLAARDSVSGKMLVIAAYTVIFVLLALYTGSIVRREQNVRKSIARLMRSVQSAEKSRNVERPRSGREFD